LFWFNKLIRFTIWDGEFDVGADVIKVKRRGQMIPQPILETGYF
jgi:hypothetical protein